MKKNFIISWEIYPFDVMVSVKEGHGDIVKRIEKTKYKLNEEEKEKLWIEETNKGRTIMLRGGQTIIRLESLEHDTIAHEIFHAVTFLMARIGVELSDKSDEAYAYAIEFLTKKIYKQLK